MYSYDKKAPILLLCANPRLSRLVHAEADGLCLSLDIEENAAACTAARLSALSLLLIDTDTITLPPTLSLPTELPTVSIGSRESDIPTLRHLPYPVPVEQLRVLLRTLCAGPAAAAANSSLPPLHLEPEKLTLHVGEHTVSLTEKETAVLALLLARRGDTVKKEELHRVISSGADRASNKVEVYMCHLRRKLEQPLGLRLFSTVRGLGYCLLTGYENGKDTL